MMAVLARWISSRHSFAFNPLGAGETRIFIFQLENGQRDWTVKEMEKKKIVK